MVLVRKSIYKRGCTNFKSLYGIVQVQRLSTGEVAARFEEENGRPSDVWFGGYN